MSMCAPLESLHRLPSSVGWHETTDSAQELGIRAIRTPLYPCLVMDCVCQQCATAISGAM